MIKIVVCDDDEMDREKLCRIVMKFMQETDKEYDLCAFESGEAFLVSRVVPDILFLDIVMGDKDGIEVGAEIRRINTNVLIIYGTHATGQMLKAFNNIHSFGFLLKPITENDVFCAMTDALRYMDNKLNAYSNDGIVTFLSIENVIISLYVMDIYYFEYKNRTVKIVAKDSVYICKDKIKDIAKRMERFGFSMSHQCFVVNLYHIEKIIESTIYMKDGAQISLAQKRAASLRKKLMLTVRKTVNSGGSKI